LWHNGFTSLVIDLLFPLHSITPVYKGQRGF
jgi:hypothetical protein